MEKLNHLTWDVISRQSHPAQDWPLPPAILTLGTRFQHESLPLEVGLLLPNSDGAASLVAAVVEAPERLGDRALGLFLADPFLNLPSEVAGLKDARVSWIANLPSVEQQDVEFTQQLEDVGLDFAREIERLDLLRREGFRILVALASPGAAEAVVGLAPDAVLVVPRVADFAAGFPSFRQRGAAAREVHAALRGARWQGPLLGLAAASEVAHETLWPEVLDGVVCRPRPLEISP